MNAHLAPRPAKRFSPMCPTVGSLGGSLGGPVGGPMVGPLVGNVLRRPVAVSPLQLADRILSLAQAADGAGHLATAVQLLDVMYAVLDRPH